MLKSFSKETLHEEDIVVYLKNERTGSSTTRKCKFVGKIIGFKKDRVNIQRLSHQDVFVTPEQCQNYGVDTIYPDDVVQVIISRETNNINKNREQTYKAITELLHNATEEQPQKIQNGKFLILSLEEVEQLINLIAKLKRGR